MMEKTGQLDTQSLRTAFEAALKVDAQFPEAHYNLGVLAEREGKADEALKHYEDALKVSPKFSPAIENLAAVLVTKKQQAQAASRLEAFIQADAAAIRPRVLLAQIYRDQKKFDDGLAQTRAALQRDPKNLGAFETMSGIYADMGNVPMSRLVAVRGLKVEQASAPIHHTLGRHLLAENKIPEAVIEFKRALDADPSYRPARIDLAEVALQYRDFGNAKLHYSELLKAQPNDAASLLGLGIANKGLGAGDEAKLAYEKVLALQPSNSAALLNMGILYKTSLNDFEKALAFYQKYQDNPAKAGGPSAEELKGTLIELEQTIAALKEAAKFEQMEQERAATQPSEAAPETAPETTPEADPSGAANGAAPAQGDPAAASAPAG